MTMKVVHLSCFLMLAIYSMRSAFGDQSVLRMSIVPSGEAVFRCVMTNTTDKVIFGTNYFLEGDNNIHYEILSETTEFKSGCFGPELDWDPPHSVHILPGRSVVRYVMKEDCDWAYKGSADFYMRCRWFVRGRSSTETVVGFTSIEGLIRPPTVRINPTKTNAFVWCAFIYKAKGSNALNLIYENKFGDGCDVQMSGDPIRILISTPDRKIEKEFRMISQSATNAVARNGRIIEWSLPWLEVKRCIPSCEWRRLQSTGDVDLRCKVGDCISDPMPLWIGDTGDVVEERKLRDIDNDDEDFLSELEDVKKRHLKNKSYMSPLHTTILCIRSSKFRKSIDSLLEVADYQLDEQSMTNGISSAASIFPAAQALVELQVDCQKVIWAISLGGSRKRQLILSWILQQRMGNAKAAQARLFAFAEKLKDVHLRKNIQDVLEILAHSSDLIRDAKLEK